MGEWAESGAAWLECEWADGRDDDNSWQTDSHDELWNQKLY